MTQRRWKLVVTELGRSEPVHEALVDAGDWMTALTRARAQFGESGGVPAGASCAVSPDGQVTVLDGFARRQYVLGPMAEPNPTPAAEMAKAAAPPRNPKRTMAYMPASPGSPAESWRPAPIPGTGAGRPVTVPPPSSLLPPAPEPVATPEPEPVATPEPEPVATPEPESASRPVSPDIVELLYARDGEPTADSPLTYRERTFTVPEGTTADDAEMLILRQFAEIREELTGRPKGKLVNMAVFDHRWQGRPERPPLVTLQWKDWRGEVDVQRPTTIRSISPPRRSLPPSMPPPSQRPSGRPPGSEAGGRRPEPKPVDERLAHAFEALQDLFFLGSAVEGAEFVLQLLHELIPSEASSVCIYDINTDELRFVALTGPGSDERRGDAIPLGQGLIGATADSARPMLIEQVANDPRFDPGIDGRVGIDHVTMALVPVLEQGRLEAVLQLINRHGQPHFSRGDSSVLVYVGQKFGEFLHRSRLNAGARAHR